MLKSSEGTIDEVNEIITKEEELEELRALQN